MSVGRTIAAYYITVVGDRLKVAASQARLTRLANALIGWVVTQMQTRSLELADGSRTKSNKMSRSAAVLSQQNALIAQLAMAKTGSAVIASTGQVIPAQGNYNEGFGGLMRIAMMTFAAGSKYPSDVAQALLPLTTLEPTGMRQIAASMPNVESVQNELKLCEIICAYVRRVTLVQSIIAGIKVAPSKQPDASLTRTRLLEQLDAEISLASRNPTLTKAMRRLRGGVVKYTGWFSVGGGGFVKVPGTSAGKPLAVTAADMYGPNGSATGKDAELMELNGVDHPLFGPKELAALLTNENVSVSDTTPKAATSATAPVVSST